MSSTRNSGAEKQENYFKCSYQTFEGRTSQSELKPPKERQVANCPKLSQMPEPRGVLSSPRKPYSKSFGSGKTVAGVVERGEWEWNGIKRMQDTVRDRNGKYCSQVPYSQVPYPQASHSQGAFCELMKCILSCSPHAFTTKKN